MTKAHKLCKHRGAPWFVGCAEHTDDASKCHLKTICTVKHTHVPRNGFCEQFTPKAEVK